MNEGNFSNRMLNVVRFAREEAIKLKHDYLGTEHLLLGMLCDVECVGTRLLSNAWIDIAKLTSAIKDTIGSGKSTITEGNIPLTKQGEKVLKMTYLEAKLFKSEVIGTEFLLLSLLRDEDNIAAQILNQFNFTYDTARFELDKLIRGTKPKINPLELLKMIRTEIQESLKREQQWIQKLKEVEENLTK